MASRFSYHLHVWFKAKFVTHYVAHVCVSDMLHPVYINIHLAPNAGHIYQLQMINCKTNSYLKIHFIVVGETIHEY